MALVQSTIPFLLGAGTIAQLGNEVRKLGGTKVFLITDPGLSRAGVTQRVVDALEKSKLEVVVFDSVEANPSSQCVEEGANKLRSCGAGVVVTLGGGSSMDAGKAMTVLSAQPIGSSIAEFCMSPALQEGADRINPASVRPKKFPPNAKAPPIIAVPTTSGTASETNGAAVITCEGRKLIFQNPGARAQLVVLDPTLTTAVPAYPTATCGMDVLTHATEAFTANGSNALSDSIALGAIKLVAEYLPKVMREPENVEYRTQMHLASHMAGIAFGIAGLGLVHAMGHPLSAMYHQAHGQTLSTLLPHIMEFNLESCKEKYAQVAMAFGVHHPQRSVDENARRALSAIAQLSIDVGTAKSIRTLGGREADIPALVQQALTDVCMLATPRHATAKDMESLYRKAWDNDKLYPALPMSKL